MTRLDYVRIHVHDFTVTHFLKKSGWALETAGPIGFKEEVVLGSKELLKLFHERKAELYIEKGTWQALVDRERGKKKTNPTARLKLEKAKKSKELERLTKELKHLQEKTQRLSGKDAKAAARVLLDVDRLRQRGAALQNEISVLQRQIDAVKK